MGRLRSLNLVSALVFLIIPLWFINDAAAFQFNVDPPKVSLSIKPGEKKSGYIHITNTSKTDIIHIKAYSLDVIYLPDGSNDFVPLGSTPWSLENWVKINPSEFDILPNQEQTVRFQVKVPPEAKGGYYGVIFFEMNAPESIKKEQTTITIGVRIGTIVLVEAAGTATYAAKITSLGAVKKDKGYQIECTVLNSGNILIRPRGKVQIIAADNKVIEQLEMNPNNEGIFPGTSRKLPVGYLKPLREGKYSVRMLLDYGGEELLGAQAAFSAEQKD